MSKQANLPARIKKVWREVNGVLLLDKPQGLTSNDALQKARRLFSAAKGGHTGTLDPMATGLLPLCFGEATKFSADLLDAEKAYETTLCLGATTDTGDAEGQVLQTRPATCTLEEVDAAIAQFVGDIQQIPPMYSALKRDGRPLYELARAGKTVEREARSIHIAGIQRLSELQDLGGDRKSITFRVACSKGTYIRVLGEDIGEVLGCGAHLTMLRRIRVSRLTLDGSISLAQLEAMTEAERDDYLHPVDSLLTELPPVLLDAAETERFGHGNPIRFANETDHFLFRVYGLNGGLLGTGRLDETGLLWPKRLIKLAI
jgi:tRNA pseudouridine55 synthase